MPEGQGYGISDGLEQMLADEQAVEQKKKEKEAVKKHIDAWFGRIKAVQQHDKFYYDRWTDDRRAARGETDDAVSVNLVAALLSILASFLYARNPDLSVKPSDSVDRVYFTAYRKFARTLEIMASRQFKDAGLKKKAKRWIRGTQTVGIAWLKAAMQMRDEKEPLMARRINDLQEQIDNVTAKEIRLELGDEDRNVLVSELQSNIMAAEERLEIQVAEGLVLDYMAPKDVVVATECGEVENYLEAPWICFINYKNKDEVLAITGWDTEEQFRWLDQANRFHQNPRTKEENKDESGVYVPIKSGDKESDKGFFIMYEIWSKDDGVIYTLIDGVTDSWAREKYVPITGKRFYPCFGLAFNYIDGERYPQSDVFQLKKLGQEYNEVRSDFRIHRQRSRPGTIFDESMIDPTDVKKVTVSKIAEFVGIKLLKRGQDINQVFHNRKYPPIDIGLYDTTPIQRDMERMSGAQEALTQGSLSVEKTATEAEIQELGRGARSDSKKDALEDELTELVAYGIQLMLQTMDQADAERYAGPEAVWYSLTTEQALQLFETNIKAGSTGKPKAKKDREAWGTLMPMMLDLIAKIGDARIQGKEYAAKPMIAILKESLNRLDDHADLEEFLPEIPPEAVEAQGKPDPEVEAKVKLDTAGSIERTASAVEKLPSLVLSPEVRALLGFDEQQEPTMDAIQTALQAPQQQAIPPAQ